MILFQLFLKTPSEPDKPAPRPPRPPPLPTVDGKSGQLDVVSRLLKDRILLLGTDVNDEVANVLVVSEERGKFPFIRANVM